MIKTCNKLGIKGIFLNTIKGIYEKPTVNIRLNNERMKDYTLRSGKRQDICFHYLHLTLHWKFYLEKSNKKENKRQRKTGKEKIKLPLFTPLSITNSWSSLNSSVLSFLHSPTLTSIHDYWKNHSLD